VWQSIRPGVTHAPPSASTCPARKPASSVRLPTRKIFPSAIAIAPFSIRPSGLPGRSSKVAMLQSTSSRSHMALPLSEPSCYGQSMAGWPNLTDLVSSVVRAAPVGLIGAPLAAGSVTPGRCDLAPNVLRETLRRIGRYDVETGRELATEVLDRGDVAISDLSIEQATPVIRDAVAESAQAHSLTLLVGGNNAVTRPGLLGLGGRFDEIGLITLDAHFDMRDLDQGLSNGNPVRALIEDGLPGANIAQVGLASFANSRQMHEDAVEAGNLIVTMDDVRSGGIAHAIDRALDHVAHCDALVIDCDIDVIDRSQFPAAPGARPGGMAVHDFFYAVRRLASDPRVRVIDLTEWDPPLDPSDLSALTAARWVAECLAGYELR
jgi:arginase family enzyme